MPEFTMKVGNVEILVLHDGEAALPLSQTFPHVPAGEWPQWQARFPETFDGDNMRAHFECYVLRSEGRTIIVDTGIGNTALNPGTIGMFGGETEGKLPAELQRVGLRAEDVDIVFLTHLHPDHVGWNLSQRDPNPAAMFPNARYLAHRADVGAFTTPHDQEIFGFTYWEETIAPLEQLGVLDLLEGERALTSEITAIPTPGHTPGSMSLAVASAGERALLLGDVFHNPAQITETEWVFGFDYDPALAVQTRTRMVERAESENTPVAICHSAGFGRVVRTEGRRYWQAAQL